MDTFLLTTALALVAASALGGILPLTRRWSERGLHLFVALAAGIFLGTIFFHLLPHLAGIGLDDGHGHGAAADDPEHAHGASIWPWAAALAGLLVLFALEKVWLPSRVKGQRTNPHAVLWSATYLGLALHALTAGFALSGVLEHPEARAQFLASVLVHKGTECFSLATVMRLAGLSTARSALLLGLFALIEPVGLLLGGSLSALHPALGPILTGFACGTFLYVAVCDLLPEVFHGTDRPRTKLLAVVAGTAVTTVTWPRLEGLAAFGADVARESFDVFLVMAPFLVLGLLLAGAVQVFLRADVLSRRIGSDDLKSVTLASVVGAPLPLCSCSVVPVAVTLRKGGASKGATSAFTVATPETGVDSIAVTWALLDPLMTIARPIGALITAIATGSAVNWLVRRGLDRDPPAPATDVAADCACDAQPLAKDSTDASQLAPAPRTSGGTSPTSDQDGGGRVARALRFASVDLLDDIAGSLIVGILLSGAIGAVIPDGWLAASELGGVGGLFLMLLVGIPFYVCASASTPIAAAMIVKGLSPGAAFVYLLAGPATNLASLVVLSRHLGRRVVIVQVVVLAGLTLLLGWSVDLAYRWLELAPAAALAPSEGPAPPWISYASAAVLGALLAASLLRTHGPRFRAAPLRHDPEPA